MHFLVWSAVYECLVKITPRQHTCFIAAIFFWMCPSKKGPLRHYQYWAAYVYKSTNNEYNKNYMPEMNKPYF